MKIKVMKFGDLRSHMQTWVEDRCPTGVEGDVSDRQLCLQHLMYNHPEVMFAVDMKHYIKDIVIHQKWTHNEVRKLLPKAIEPYDVRRAFNHALGKKHNPAWFAALVINTNPNHDRIKLPRIINTSYALFPTDKQLRPILIELARASILSIQDGVVGLGKERDGDQERLYRAIRLPDNRMIKSSIDILVRRDPKIEHRLIQALTDLLNAPHEVSPWCW